MSHQITYGPHPPGQIGGSHQITSGPYSPQDTHVGHLITNGPQSAEKTNAVHRITNGPSPGKADESYPNIQVQLNVHRRSNNGPSHTTNGAHQFPDSSRMVEV